jgi:hypothetical protein
LGLALGWQFEGIPGPFEDHATQISDQTGRAITNMEPAKRGMRAHFDVATLIMALILGAWRRDAQRNGQPSSATVTSP